MLEVSEADKKGGRVKPADVTADILSMWGIIYLYLLIY
jgi:hypothetical protein